MRIATRTRCGSSPLTRGTHQSCPGRRRVHRFIPAHAGNTPPTPPATSATPVHPRSRGEHWRATRLSDGQIGSSPLTRGTPHGGDRGSHACRFIPAHAGNTRDDADWSVGHTGSSPLTRGTPEPWPIPDIGNRFIPAHAGNTVRQLWRSLRTAVHPRSRGEHRVIGRVAEISGGSSPLTRGTRHDVERPAGHPRFIPAHAGNTTAPPRTPTRCTVHPRSRGEHQAYALWDMCTGGSSPLTRGTPELQRNAELVLRFIPAHAGNTAGSVCWMTTSPVHPRSRGEHATFSVGGVDYTGSSPLTRGTLRSTCQGSAPSTVHPRSRGEHVRARRHADPGDGSSPLTRGTPDSSALRKAGFRFIPAHAGNTLASRS